MPRTVQDAFRIGLVRQVRYKSMTMDKKQIVADLVRAHKDALAQATDNFDRYYSQPIDGQEDGFYRLRKTAIDTLNNLRELVKTYEALQHENPGKHSSARVGSVVVVRMGINNEKRSYFIHNGFLADPKEWQRRYPSALAVRLGDMQTFGLKVGDSYFSYEGRPGDEVKSNNQVIEIF